MHNSQDGVAMNFDALGTGPGTAPGQGYAHLLLFENKSDVCLRCHAGGGTYHVWSDDPLAPGSANRGGGDFVFLEEDNINDAHAGAANPILGESAGHSIISGIKGTGQDSVLATSPGGSYPSSEMGCTSCHDPHGTTAFRILYQSGQAIPGATFTATLEADGISLFGPPESNSNHNAYISGYSEWCATCHTDFHQGWTAQLIHPSGQTLTGDTVAKYNAYDGTQDCIDNPPVGVTPCGTGTQPTAYLHVVPFEDAGATTSSTAGPTGSSRVACMTCHRAHATSAPDAGRWDFNVTGLAEDGHESGSYTIPNPYGDPVQRSLCNKCHTQDEFDEARDFTP
jgi:predicted CXXCH cytochrome family protein